MKINFEKIDMAVSVLGFLFAFIGFFGFVFFYSTSKLVMVFPDIMLLMFCLLSLRLIKKHKFLLTILLITSYLLNISMGYNFFLSRSIDILILVYFLVRIYFYSNNQQASTKSPTTTVITSAPRKK